MVPFVPLCCFHTHAVICICIEFMIFPFVLYCSSTSCNLVYTLHSTAHSVSRMFLLCMWRIRHLDSFAIPSGSSNCRLTLAWSAVVDVIDFGGGLLAAIEKGAQSSAQDSRSPFQRPRATFDCITRFIKEHPIVALQSCKPPPAQKDVRLLCQVPPCH